MHVKPILPPENSKSRTTPTFTGIVAVFWATSTSMNQIFKERKKKTKERKGFEGIFFILLCCMILVCLVEA
jgi:hypothetical protein